MQQLELNNDYYVYVQDAINNFFELYKKRFGRKKPILVCIGSPRVAGDAVGPYIGSVLSELDPSLEVYGNIKFPVMATNVNNFAKKLWVKNFFNKPIIAIDACVGPSAQGTIWCLESSGVKPGEACGKQLEFVGNTAIIVNTANKSEDLATVDNFRITRISSIIAKSIYDNLCNL